MIFSFVPIKNSSTVDIVSNVIFTNFVPPYFYNLMVHPLTDVCRDTCVVHISNRCYDAIKTYAIIIIYANRYHVISCSVFELY